MPDWTGSRRDLVRSLRLIPEVLAGTYPDALGLGAIFWGYVGNAVLQLIQDDYLAKMDGLEGTDGITWAGLKPSTLRTKRPLLPHVKDEILAETGKLLKSLRYPNPLTSAPVGEPDQVFDIKPGSVMVGTKEAKADFHQNGNPARNLPARPIVPPDGQIPPGWEEGVEEAMSKAFALCVEQVVANGGIP